MSTPQSPLSLFRTLTGVPLFLAGFYALWTEAALVGLVALLCALYLSFPPAKVTGLLRIPYWEGLSVLLVVLVLVAVRAFQ
ncbi:MAG: hypothetical protein R3296_06845 [Oleiphilaceae bacterium]|nr:hypothetical protein [Oleiphilaceae bacterium]